MTAIQDLARQARLYLPKFVLALVVLVVGLCIINCIVRLVASWLERARLPTLKRKQSSELADVENSVDSSETAAEGKMDPTLLRFGAGTVSVVLKIVLLISVAAMVGISTSSFVAVLAMAGLAIGLALQGLLTDFASGVLLLVLRPYSIGDVVEIAEGATGKVTELKLFVTELRTVENTVVVVPNGKVTGGAITNITAEPSIRLDVDFKISHDDDLRRSQAAMLQAASKEPRILRAPAPEALVMDIEDTGVKVVARVWVRRADHLDVPPALRERVKLAFDAEGLDFARHWEFRGKRHQ